MSRNNNICVVSLQSYDRNFVYGKYNNFEQNHPLFFLNEFRKLVPCTAYLLVDKKETELFPAKDSSIETVDLKKEHQPDFLLSKINRFFSRILFLNPRVLVDFLYPQRLRFFKKIKPYIDKCGILYVSAEPAILPILYARLKGKKVIYQSYGMYYELVYSTFKDSRSFIAKSCWLVFSVFIYCMEKIAYSLCHVILTISAQDKRFLERKFFIKPQSIYVYPFVFDINQFLLFPDKDLPVIRRELGFKDNQAIITYAAFHLDANQSYNVIKFLRNKVVPLLKEQNITFRFLILGKKTDDPIFHDDDYFSFPGYFYDTKVLSKYMSITDICVAPTTVRNGVKSKTITYMAYQKPTVSTPEGTNGLEVVDGKQLLICPLDAFPGRILELIRYPQLSKDVGINARSFVEKEFSYNSVFGHFRDDLEKWSVVDLGPDS